MCASTCAKKNLEPLQLGVAMQLTATAERPASYTAWRSERSFGLLLKSSFQGVATEQEALDQEATEIAPPASLNDLSSILPLALTVFDRSSTVPRIWLSPL
jgi:hypothetical protein